MRFSILLALAAMSLSLSIAEKLKARRSSIFNLPANAKLRAEDVEQFLRLQSNYDDVNAEPVAGELRQAAGIEALPAEALKPDSSSSRMFLKKLLLFGNMFGSSQSTQPIIPIIITGTGSTAGTTQTVTTTGTITGTGTVTTSPTGRAEADDYLIGEEDVYDDQLVYGKANANKQPNIIKLKQGKGNQQGVSFMVPQKYMRYFQNNPNTLLVNPGVYNKGAGKLRKVQLTSNGNIKRKRARSPVHRFASQ